MPPDGVHVKRDTDQTSKLWVSSTHHAGFTLSGLRHLIKRLSKQVGFRVKPHKMRHTFATQTYQGSRDIASIQQALGHRDLKTTMIYTHVLPTMTAPTLEQNPVGFLF